MSGKSVAKKGEGLVVQADAGAQVPDYIKNESRGSENVGMDDIVIPRLEIVQSLSPARDKHDAQYIPGAEEGMLFNSVTRQLYGDSVIFVPVLFRKEYLLWRDRKKGGGFGGSYDSVAEADLARNEREDPSNWDIVDTAQHFGLIINDASGSTEEIVLSMARTKLKVSRRLNSLVRLNGGDRFARAYVLSGVREENAEGQSYYNFDVKNFGFPTLRVYSKAEHLWRTVTEGDRTIEADMSDADEVPPEPSADRPAF